MLPVIEKNIKFSEKETLLLKLSTDNYKGKISEANGAARSATVAVKCYCLNRKRKIV